VYPVWYPENASRIYLNRFLGWPPSVVKGAFFLQKVKKKVKKALWHGIGIE